MHVWIRIKKLNSGMYKRKTKQFYYETHLWKYCVGAIIQWYRSTWSKWCLCPYTNLRSQLNHNLVCLFSATYPFSFFLLMSESCVCRQKKWGTKSLSNIINVSHGLCGSFYMWMRYIDIFPLCMCFFFQFLL